MRKHFLFVLFVAVLCLFVSCATKKAVNEGDERLVAAVFTKDDGQLYIEKDGDREYLDTMWVYYTDGTFEQYVEGDDDNLLLFSTGTYKLDGGDFVFDEGEVDYGDITIERDKKYQNGKLSGYSSSHTYDLGSLGFVQLYALDERDSRHVEAVFYGLDKQLFVERDGEREYLDTIWIYYSDMSFEQYASVDDKMILFSSGTYAFEDGGDFIYEAEEDDCGDILITRTMKYSATKGLEEYSSMHLYDLNSLGFVPITAHID